MTRIKKNNTTANPNNDAFVVLCNRLKERPRITSVTELKPHRGRRMLCANLDDGRSLYVTQDEDPGTYAASLSQLDIRSGKQVLQGPRPILKSSGILKYVRLALKTKRQGKSCRRKVV